MNSNERGEPLNSKRSDGKRMYKKGKGRRFLLRGSEYQSGFSGASCMFTWSWLNSANHKQLQLRDISRHEYSLSEGKKPGGGSASIFRRLPLSSLSVRSSRT